MKTYPNIIPLYNDSKTVKEKREDMALDLFTLPLISQFRLFQFSGLADNTFLTGNFVPADIQGKTIVIKSIKIIPYYQIASEDFFIDDGATQNIETIPANCRVNRVFDVYDYGCQLSLLINGSRVPMFPSEVLIVPPAADGNVPLDLDLDNIYYKYPAALTDLQVSIDAQIFTALFAPPKVGVPNVKVFIGCYLI